MELIEWNDSYIIGIAVIDKHHQLFVNIINESNYAVHLNNRRKIGLIINDLSDYAKFCLGNEERLMFKYDYPLRVKHAEDHLNLYNQIYDMNADLIADNALYTIQIVTFLKDWLKVHILGYR